MKKTLVILMGLFAFSLAVIVFAGATLGIGIENAEFKETVIYGDVSEVEGVIVRRSLKWENLMYWNTSYTVGDSEGTKTDYNCYLYEKADSYEYSEPVLSFMDPYTTPILDPDVEPKEPLQKALFDFFKEAPNGETTHKMISLKNYTEYYAFDLSVNMDGFSFWIEEQYAEEFAADEDTRKQYEVLEHFNDFFKIPVIEQEYYRIGVKKSEDGQLLGYYCRTENLTFHSGDIEWETEFPDNADSFQFNVHAIAVGDTCYFTFCPYTLGGTLVDTSLIPGGYGVYSFKYDDQSIDKDSLKLEYVLEPTESVELRLDAQKENLLVFYESKGQSAEKESYLTVLDLQTMKEKQTVLYGRTKAEQGTGCYWIYDDFMVAKYNNMEAAVLSRKDDGTFQLEYVVSARTEVSGTTNFLSRKNSFDWDGEKLLVAGANQTIEESYVPQKNNYINPITGKDMVEYSAYIAECSFFIGVFDRDGIRYYGEYACSLDTDWYSQKNCTATNMEQIEVSWPEVTP